MTTLRHHRQRGFALIESLVAFAVLGIGLVALLRIQPELRAQAETARQRSEAVRLAQQEIDGLRGFATLQGFAAMASGAYALEPDGLGSPRYALERRVDALSWPGSRSVDVRVTWTDRRGEEQLVTLSTVIAAHEPALAAQRLLTR